VIISIANVHICLFSVKISNLLANNCMAPWRMNVKPKHNNLRWINSRVAVRPISFTVTMETFTNEQVLERSRVRSRRLRVALDHLRGHAALVEALTDWLTDVHTKLLAANDMPPPDDVTAVRAVIGQQKVNHLLLIA